MSNILMDSNPLDFTAKSTEPEPKRMKSINTVNLNTDIASASTSNTISRDLEQQLLETWDPVIIVPSMIRFLKRISIV